MVTVEMRSDVLRDLATVAMAVQPWKASGNTTDDRFLFVEVRIAPEVVQMAATNGYRAAVTEVRQPGGAFVAAVVSPDTLTGLVDFVGKDGRDVIRLHFNSSAGDPSRATSVEVTTIDDRTHVMECLLTDYPDIHRLFQDESRTQVHSIFVDAQMLADVIQLCPTLPTKSRHGVRVNAPDIEYSLQIDARRQSLTPRLRAEGWSQVTRVRWKYAVVVTAVDETPDEKAIRLAEAAKSSPDPK